MKETFRKLWGVTVVVGTLLVVKLVIPLFYTSAAITVQNSLHMGWNSARSEIRRQFEAELKNMDIDPLKKSKYLDCITDKSIDFLNGTTCSYHYNKVTTTKAEHIKQQDACVEKSGYIKKVEEMGYACAQDILVTAH